MCADPTMTLSDDTNSMNHSLQKSKRCKTDPGAASDGANEGKSDVIRKRLLHRLGIEMPLKPVSLQSSRIIEEGHTGAFTVALKDDDEKSVPRKGSVCFDAAVKVHPIPSRLDYSERMKSVLWTPQIEIVQNAARNTLEFAAEGWDFSKVVDDEDMVVFQGEKIHPIHFVEDIQQHLTAALR